MLRFLAIPLMIMSGLPNNEPPACKPADPVVRQVLEAEPCECPCIQGSVFHGGAVARFGLNKTALRPQGEKKFKNDYFGLMPDGEKLKDPVMLQSGKGTKLPAEPIGDLVSPLTINLFF